ncbi:MAG: LysR family transcriptional regulator substrate-binding protein [Nocardioidaceae bacterium]
MPPDPLAQRRLRVGFVPGVTPDKWARRWAERHPRSPLDLVRVEESAQRDALLDGTVDACFVRGEVDPADLYVIRLYEEVPVVAVSREHPISVFDEVTSKDLDEEHVVLPLSVARLRQRRDEVAVPVTDVAPFPVALAFTRAADGAVLQELVGVVRGRTARSSRS